MRLQDRLRLKRIRKFSSLNNKNEKDLSTKHCFYVYGYKNKDLIATKTTAVLYCSPLLHSVLLSNFWCCHILAQTSLLLSYDQLKYDFFYRFFFFFLQTPFNCQKMSEGRQATKVSNNQARDVYLSQKSHSIWWFWCFHRKTSNP